MPRFKHAAAATLYESLTEGIDLFPLEPPIGYLPQLVLHVSEGCNLGCAYCFADKGQYGSPSTRWMKPSLVVEALDRLLKRFDFIGNIKFFGGEPMLNLDAIEACCNHMRQRFEDGITSRMTEFGLVSNMTVCDDRSVDLVRDHAIWVTGSIDGPEHVHDFFRTYHSGSGSFSTVDSNIMTYRRETGQPRALEVVYSPVHLKAGMSMMDVHTFLLERYGSDIHVFMHPLAPPSNLVQLMNSDSGDAFTDGMYEMSFDYGRSLVTTSRSRDRHNWLRKYLRQMLSRTKNDAHCDLGVNTITLGASGTIYPCYTLIGRDEFVMSEIGDANELDGGRFVEVQNRFIGNRKSSNPICSKCSIVSTCKACPGSMLSQNGSLSSPTRIACDYLTGFVEGVMTGINDLRADSHDWADLLQVP